MERLAVNNCGFIWQWNRKRRRRKTTRTNTVCSAEGGLKRKQETGHFNVSVCLNKEGSCELIRQLINDQLNLCRVVCPPGCPAAPVCLGKACSGVSSQAALQTSSSSSPLRSRPSLSPSLSPLSRLLLCGNYGNPAGDCARCACAAPAFLHHHH